MLTPWDAVDEARRDTQKARTVGAYSLVLIEYDKYDYSTGERRIVRVPKRLWIENAEGEGMECDPSLIPEDVTEEWLNVFWKKEF